MPRPWVVPALAAALTGVLSSGVTAVIVRSQIPDVFAIRGPLELTQEQRHLVELLVDPGERFVPTSVGAPVRPSRSLTSLGYVRGWSRTFHAGRQQLDAIVLEFAAADGAVGYARGIGGAAQLLAKPEPFALPDIPGASGLVDTVKADDGRYVHLVSLHRGPRAALLVFRDEAPGASGDLLALAMRQYDALAG